MADTACRNCGDASFDRTGVCWRPECIAAMSRERENDAR